MTFVPAIPQMMAAPMTAPMAAPMAAPMPGPMPVPMPVPMTAPVVDMRIPVPTAPLPSAPAPISLSKKSFPVLDENGEVVPNLNMAYDPAKGYYFYDNVNAFAKAGVAGDTTGLWERRPVMTPEGMQAAVPYGSILYVNTELNSRSLIPPTEKEIENFNRLKSDTEEFYDGEVVETCDKPPANTRHYARDPEVCPKVPKDPSIHFCMAICGSKDKDLEKCKKYHGYGPYRRLSTRTIQVPLSPGLLSFTKNGFGKELMERIRKQNGTLHLCDEHYDMIVDHAKGLNYYKAGAAGVGVLGLIAVGALAVQAGALSAAVSGAKYVGGSMISSAVGSLFSSATNASNTANTTNTGNFTNTGNSTST